ncbi:hypothetical protein VitviT2T_003583 [Vitis vinifera]|uniref:ACT domain-containing protein ACR n=1 Tax=Vitis vinifera TaxID=29760 RepID=A0ABY9BMY6_VITVI|nr:hypothetical protein VitviT2T_003583 [Vitis vinifera]
MFADHDYQRVERAELGKDKSSRSHVTVLDCIEKDYTVITMRSKDRPKLLFDTVCTLTDMQYVVFHGAVHTGRMEAYQCLEAAIERRAFEGLKLELYTEDRFGLLSDITRVFKETSLCIKIAKISTEGGKAKDTFYVTDVIGNSVNPHIIDSIRQQIGHSIL